MPPHSPDGRSIHPESSSSRQVASTPRLVPAHRSVEIRSPAEPNTEDLPTCWICAEPVVIYAVGLCSHRTCHVCALRLRALYKKLECTFCKTPLDHIIFTSSPDKPFEAYEPDALPYHDASLGIAFETSDQREDSLSLLRFNCPDATCDQICSGWGDLRRHAKREHGRHMCDLCIRHQKVFAHEHTLFTAAQLKGHIDEGDNAPNKPSTSTATPSGFTGHPLCDFCGVNYYDADDLFKHCREKHEQCFICVRNGTGRMDYYVDYPALEKHFNERHYTCDHPDCRSEKMTNVFETMLELQDHRVEKHGADASKQAKRDARRIEVNITRAEPSGLSRRQEEASLGRRREESAAKPTFVTVHGSNLAPGRNVPGLGPSRRPNESTANQSRQGRPVSPLPASIGSEAERHQALMHRVEEAVSFTEGKVSAFKAAVRSYRNSETAAPDLLDVFYAIFDHRMAVIEEIVKELVALLDTPGKRADLLSAWHEFHIDQDAFPSLAPVSSMLGVPAAATVAPKAPAGAQKIANGTARAKPGMNSLAARSGQSNPAVWARVQAAANNSAAFPALPATTRSKIVGTTAWSTSAQGGATPTRPTAKPSAPSPAPVRSLGAAPVTVRSINAPTRPLNRATMTPSKVDFPDLPASAAFEAKTAARRAVLGVDIAAPLTWGAPTRLTPDSPLLLEGEIPLGPKKKGKRKQLLFTNAM